MTLAEQARALGLNPRWVAYANSQGRTPAIQLAHDQQAWPGGSQTGFILWARNCWVVWKTLHGYRLDQPMDDAQHAAFDAWLAERYPPMEEAA